MSIYKESIYDLIFDITRQIPIGRVTSYGAIAQCIGSKGSARLVGWAMSASQALTDIPAHRVVNRNGLLTGKHHFATPTLMQERLEKEGIKVINDKVQEFDKIFWDPIELI